MKRNNGFQKQENTSRPSGENNYCHKNFKPSYFIKDCPIHKTKYKDYVNVGGDKEKRKNRVSDKSKRRIVADYVVKQALAAWGDSSSEPDESEHPKMLRYQLWKKMTLLSTLFIISWQNLMMMKMKRKPFLTLRKTLMNIR